jgi:hypothetical protein
MTPLTHGAVGSVIYQRCRRIAPKRWSLVIALPLAFASHYLLDAIPHFEMVPPPLRRYGVNLVVMVALFVTGTVLGLLLIRWNRQAGKILLILFLWVSISVYSPVWLRVLTGIAGLLFLWVDTGGLLASTYLLAGMVAAAPDFIPYSYRALTALHNRIHFHTDLGLRLFLHFERSPVPYWRARLHNPYFLAGYGLELLIEAVVFWCAIYILCQERFSPGDVPRVEVNGRLPVSKETGEVSH